MSDLTDTSAAESAVTAAKTDAESAPAAAKADAEVDKMVKRLRRVEGQVRGLQRMVAEGAPCEDVLTQLSATRAALDRVGIFLITHKVRECLQDEGDASSETAVQRALETFQRYAQHLQVQPGSDQP
jgi:CsoR family transcriptional regulator, copper-sensing transcriptional repressor